MLDFFSTFVLTLVLVSNLAVCARLRPRGNTGWLVGTKPPEVVCSLNPCEREICRNAGVCIQDENTCNFKCECTDDFDGLFCEQRVEEANDNAASVAETIGVVTTLTPLAPDCTTEVATHDALFLQSSVCTTGTLRPDIERRCLPGLVCKYGRCSDVGLKCLCDPGGYGQLCGDKCCLNCLSNGTCRLFENGTAYCDCPDHLTVKQCERHKPEPITRRVTQMA